MHRRILSPLEQNHLRKYGFNPDLELADEKPVEYITGHAVFCELDFLVNESTLIPRIESESIVRLAYDHIQSKGTSHPTIADVGTGSGCLGISLAFKLSQEHIPYTIYLSDISTSALSVAEENATKLLPSTANLFFEPSDLLENYPKIRFDVVMANLPYIPTKNIPTLDPAVKDYEPITALDGGPNGTTLINKLLIQLPDFLSDTGLAILEIDDTQTIGDFTIPIGLSSGFEKDLYGVPRFLKLQRKL
jgi:release factor glutamine methyltransferase